MRKSAWCVLALLVDCGDGGVAETTYSVPDDKVSQGGLAEVDVLFLGKAAVKPPIRAHVVGAGGDSAPDIELAFDAAVEGSTIELLLGQLELSASESEFTLAPPTTGGTPTRNYLCLYDDVSQRSLCALEGLAEVKRSGATVSISFRAVKFGLAPTQNWDGGTIEVVAEMPSGRVAGDAKVECYTTVDDKPAVLDPGWEGEFCSSVRPLMEDNGWL